MSLFIFFNENINTRIKSFISLKNDFSTQVRIQAIKSSVKPFLNSPLIGHGLGTYSARKIPGDRVIFEGLDCFYVNFILTNGLLGLMIFLTPVLLVFNKSLLLFNQIKTNGFIVGTFCSLIVFLVGAFFDSMLTTSTYIIVLYWFYYGLLLRELHEHN
ncbi:MAG: hypothetical protein A2252_08360 [Elusimicrobia bacterium RIFOXYA2_FULL_39_19]|nr:MAG: hypothetical protein A2252_08360 [Elusimicrobia bacterium RIFOXYA2_FULL_39_19]